MYNGVRPKRGGLRLKLSQAVRALHRWLALASEWKAKHWPKPNSRHKKPCHYWIQRVFIVWCGDRMHTSSLDVIQTADQLGITPLRSRNLRPVKLFIQNTGLFTPAIIYFYYQNMYFEDQSIKKHFI